MTPEFTPEEAEVLLPLLHERRHARLRAQAPAGSFGRALLALQPDGEEPEARLPRRVRRRRGARGGPPRRGTGAGRRRVAAARARVLRQGPRRLRRRLRRAARRGARRRGARVERRGPDARGRARRDLVPREVHALRPLRPEGRGGELPLAPRGDAARVTARRGVRGAHGPSLLDVRRAGRPDDPAHRGDPSDRVRRGAASEDGRAARLEGRREGRGPPEGGEAGVRGDRARARVRRDAQLPSGRDAHEPRRLRDGPGVRAPPEPPLREPARRVPRPRGRGARASSASSSRRS